MVDRQLARKHLDRRLDRLRPIEGLQRPPKGWIRALRDALGMTAAQLAARLDVSQPRILAMEKGEQSGALTLSSLARVAEALDCTLVYALVPKHSLEDYVHSRAEHIAAAQLSRADHTMRLEDQAVEASALNAERERLTADLLRGNLRRLWD